MRLSFLLFRYISKQFFASICLVLLGLTAIGMLLDLIELIRRASHKEFVPFSAIIGMALYKAPGMAEKFLPFAVLIGSMLSLTKLTRSQELVVARAAGVSVWQFLLPAIMVVGALGMFMITVFNPFSALMLLRFEQIEGKYITGQASMLAVSPSGLWLRQKEQEDAGVSEHIIYALRIDQADMTLSDVTVFSFDEKGDFLERHDAERATLGNGALALYDVTIARPGIAAEFREREVVPTALTLSHIQDSFASPETMPFWTLPAFIETLEQAGFSGLRHRLHWHSMLSTPLLLVGMVLVAAVFSLRLPRRGKVGLMVVAGIATGFALYFFTDLTQAFGAAGALPIVLAAWAPALVMLFSGTAALLHLEDG